MVKGFRNVLFGGEGLFLATLRGPGRVFLQSMPIVNLAEEIFRHSPTHNVGADSGSGSVVGDIIGGLFKS
jgi:hypothetical protein